MYNGIGLQTARGSGTNGHVQRNLSFVRPGKKTNIKYKTESDLIKAEAANNRQPNDEILEHERKRKIELKCLEFEEILEDQNYTAEEIAAKVQSYREKLMSDKKDEQLPKDEFGRYAVRETHQVAAAQQEKNAMLRSAFGISEYFVEGSSFDADRKAKEVLAKSAALQKELEAQHATDAEKNKKYKLVRTPSRERETVVDSTTKPKDEKEKSSKKTDDKKKRKRDDEKSKSSRKHKKDDRKKSQRTRRDSSSDDSSDSDDEKSKRVNRRSKKHDGGKKKSGRDQKNSKKSGRKRRRHSTSSDTSDSSSSSSSSSSPSTDTSASPTTSSSSSTSSNNSSPKRQKRKYADSEPDAYEKQKKR